MAECVLVQTESADGDGQKGLKAPERAYKRVLS